MRRRIDQKCDARHMYDRPPHLKTTTYDNKTWQAHGMEWDVLYDEAFLAELAKSEW
jgi:hypothetical protein